MKDLKEVHWRMVGRYEKAYLVISIKLLSAHSYRVSRKVSSTRTRNCSYLKVEMNNREQANQYSKDSDSQWLILWSIFNLWPVFQSLSTVSSDPFFITRSSLLCDFILPQLSPSRIIWYQNMFSIITTWSSRPPGLTVKSLRWLVDGYLFFPPPSG